MNPNYQFSLAYFLFFFRVNAFLAGACILFDNLPEKLNPVIRPLMDVIKKEENYHLQVKYLHVGISFNHSRPCIEIIAQLIFPGPLINLPRMSIYRT